MEFTITYPDNFREPREYVSLKDKEEWLLRPVIRHMCLYESLGNGALDLCDIALMNDALDVFDENERRVQAANLRK